LRLLPSLSDEAPNAPSPAPHSSPSSPSRGVFEIQSARPGDGDIVIRVSAEQRVRIAVAVVLLSSSTGEDDSALLDLVLRATEFTPASVEPECICAQRDEWVSDSCPVHGREGDAA
jgi:hypothetical protein